VSESAGVKAEVRVYDRLFNVVNPAAAESIEAALNPDSKMVYKHCFVESSLADAKPESRFQFERLGYYVADRFDHDKAHPVFNRTVTLRDTWAK